MRTIRDEDRDRGERESVRIEDVRCVRATDKAILVSVQGAELWIPQSHVTDDSEVYQAGDEGTLVITKWIAEQKGLA